MPETIAGRIALAKRLIGWGLVILVLYSATMTFVMFFSLASAYEKLQSITATGSVTQEIDSTKLKGLQNDARRAQSASQDISVAALDWLPWFGSDIHAARVLSVGLEENLMVLTPLIEQRDAISLGQSDLPKTLKALSGSINSLDEAITRFDANLKTVKAKDLHFGLAPKVEKLKAVLGSVQLAVHEGSPLLKAAAVVLNQEGKTSWFIATQNAAELRASGGLLGSYAVITVNNGKISLTDFGADAKLLAKGKLHVNFSSQVDNSWGADLADWRDLNVSSHIPDDGQIILDAWSEKFNQKLDGVIFFSQGTVAHLVGATGEVQVKGQVLNSDNTVDFLTKDIYKKFTNVKKKNEVVSLLMKQLFGKLSESKVNPTTLFDSLSNPQNEDTIYMWSNQRNIQSDILNAGLDGSLPLSSGSDVIVGLNNGGGNKLDAYLSTKYEYVRGKCGLKTWEDLAGRESTVTVTLTNNAPKKGLPWYVNPRLDLRAGQKWVPGSNREVVSVYVPIGSSDEQIFIDGKADGASFTTSQNHPLYVTAIELAPGQTRVLTVRFIEPITDSSGRALSRKPTFRAQRTLGGTEISVKPGEFCQVG